MSARVSYRITNAPRGLVLWVLLVAAPVSAGASGLWSSAALVGVDDDWDAISASVGVVADGTVLIVWSGVDAEQWDGEVFYVTIKDGIQSEQALVHEPNTGMDRIPFMSVGGDGIPWIVWERYGDGYEQVVSHLTGNSWSVPETVMAQGGRYDSYNIYSASSSDVWVARSSRPAGRDDREIFLRHWDGVAWGESEQIGIENRDDVYPVMVRGSDSRLWLAWLCDLAIPGRNVVYAAYRDSTGWSEPGRVDTTAGNIHVSDIDLCPDGRPIVVWQGNGYTTSTDIEYAVREEWGWEFGGLVNEPDDIWEDTDLCARLSRGPAGQLWVVWTSGFFGVQSGVATAARWTGEGWTGEELASAPDTSQLSVDNRPDVAVAGDGIVWSVWERQDDAPPWDTDVYVSYRDMATPVDFWGFAAEVLGGAVRLVWHTAGAYGDLGFDVWRLTHGEEVEEQPAGIPEEAERLTDVPVGDCAECEYVDRTVEAAQEYWYWLRTQDGSMTFGPVVAAVPAEEPVATEPIVLVHPNPTSEGAYLAVHGSEVGPAAIKIYNVGGRLVRTIPVRPAGDGSAGAVATAYWDGRDFSGMRMPGGVYYAVLEVDGRMVGSARGTVVVLR